MPTRNRWMAFPLTGLFLVAAAGLAYAAVSEEAAAGATAIETDSDVGEVPQVRQSKIKLVLDHDGSAERLELVDLQELEVGESRTLATERGTPVVVTRDAEGFEIDLDGRKIRLTDHFAAQMPAGSWTSEDGETRQFHKQIVVHEGGEGEGGESNVMIVRNRVAAGKDGVVVAGGDAEEAEDAAVVVMRRTGPDSHGFAFATAGGELPAIALPLEVTIQRLEASPKFQELDAASRAKVVEALRESAPKAGGFVAGEPGSKAIVLEIEEED
jgi:hypothetical protein